jgi:DNA-binding winged helix-turn-helix (wHTH) protein/tetratricopeptide (TPR) repeat protein/TolB-like protein
LKSFDGPAELAQVQENDVYFDDFHLDLSVRILRRNEVPIDLTAKEFEALRVLAQQAGTPVAHETLIAELWGPHTELEQSTLPQHISRLRKKLGKNRDGQPYIKALPGRGYFLAADVSRPPAGASLAGTPLAGPPTAAPPAAAPTTPSRVSEWRRLVFSHKFGWLVLVVLLITAVTMAVDPQRRHKRIAVVVVHFHGTGPEGAASWLTTAIPEMLRTELSVRDTVRVVSGDDVARAEAELHLHPSDVLGERVLRQLQDELGAEYVLTGSYTVLPDSQIMRVDTVLEDARRRVPVAADSQSGPIDSIFQMVGRSGVVLRAALNVSSVTNVETAALSEALPSSLQATQLLAEGLVQLRMSNYPAAEKSLEKASVVDPHSAVIRSTLAESWAKLGYESRAREEACQADHMSPPVSRSSQLLLEARCRELSHDWERAIAVYQSLWTFFPDELDNALRLAHTQVVAGRTKDAERTIAELQNSPSAGGDPRVDLAAAEAAEARGDFAGEVKAAESAIRKAEKTGASLAAAQAQLRECWALSYIGERARALQLANSAEKKFAELGDRGGQATALKNIADVIDDGGDHANGVLAYQKALVAFRQIGSETGVALVLNNMGIALGDGGDLDGATVSFKQSFSIAHRIGDLPREALALANLGTIYWRRGDFGSAEPALSDAELIFERAGDWNHAATAMGNLGLIYKDAGQLGDAEQRLNQAFDMSRRTGDQTGMARTSGNQGDLLVKLGRLTQASEKYERELSIATKLGEDNQRAYALFGIGQVLLLEGKFSAALAKLKESLDLRLRHNEYGLAAESRAGLAEAEIEAGDAAGIMEAKQAEDQFRKEDEPEEEAGAEALLVKAVLGGLGGTREACEAHSAKLQKLLPRIQDHSVRSLVHLATARCLAANGKLQEASLRLSLARDESKRSNDVQSQLEVDLALADANTNRVLRRQALDLVEQQAMNGGFGEIAAEAGKLRAADVVRAGSVAVTTFR